MTSTKTCHYDLPSGAAGRNFVELLSSELNLLAEGSVRSERVMVFLEVMLQRDPYVRKGMDIRRLLSRRLEDWRSEKFDSLLCETERCSGKRYTPRFTVNKDHVSQVFTRLMLRGQVRSAVRFITDRLSGGGVLSPQDASGVDGKSVLDVLQEKHPSPAAIKRSAFVHVIIFPLY